MRAEQNYYPWVDDIYAMSDADRIKNIKKMLNNFASIGGEENNVAKYISSNGEFKKICSLPFLYIIPMIDNRNGSVLSVKFKKPTIAAAHKNLPLIICLSESNDATEKWLPIKDVKNFNGTKQLLKYADTLSSMKSSSKEELSNLLIDGIRTYRSNKTKKKEWLSDYLTQDNDFSLCGFSLNFPYINIQKKHGDTKPFWIHPWGTPQLFYTHKRLPVMMIVGPSVRLDKNVLGESDMLGFTG